MPLRVTRLRYKLILLFLLATVVPTAGMLWMSLALLRHSMSFIATEDMDQLSRSLESIAREYYRQSCEDLKRDALAEAAPARKWDAGELAAASAELRQFQESADTERCVLGSPDSGRLDYMVRRDGGIRIYSRRLGIQMEEVTQQYRRARMQVENLRSRDLDRGFAYTLILIGAVIWVIALAGVIYMANRVSRPILGLTAGLRRLAGGDFDVRLPPGSNDEVGRAVQAFNQTADDLRRNREKLVYLTQIAGWQRLARKMAHEIKNSLTPIRLTVEEIEARQPVGEGEFLSNATRAVIREVESLERRVRAFSEFAAEPVAKPEPLDINSMMEERVRFLKVAHPDVEYTIAKREGLPDAWADGDQVRGILTNLLENAAEAAGPGGRVQAVTSVSMDGDGCIVVEVHDSGPGLSDEARRSLFEPSISFKKNGMGLGLSISRKNALLAGGDLRNIEGALGGAGFRLALPVSGNDAFRLEMAAIPLRLPLQ